MTQSPAFEPDGRVYPESLSQRYELGSPGRGWSHNWQMSLGKESEASRLVKSGANVKVA